MIKISLADGSIREYEQALTVAEIAKDISENLLRAACAATVNGKVCDLRDLVSEDSQVTIHSFDSKEGKKAFWHTSSHILALAVKRLFPDVKLAIGPATEAGFYYDFDFSRTFNSDDIVKIEAEMKKIIKEDLPIERFVMPRAEAVQKMRDSGEIYKVELILDLPEDEEISFYQFGDFVDLCAGPHLLNTKPLKAVKILSENVHLALTGEVMKKTRCSAAFMQ